MGPFDSPYDPTPQSVFQDGPYGRHVNIRHTVWLLSSKQRKVPNQVKFMAKYLIDTHS